MVKFITGNSKELSLIEAFKLYLKYMVLTLIVSVILGILIFFLQESNVNSPFLWDNKYHYFQDTICLLLLLVFLISGIKNKHLNLKTITLRGVKNNWAALIAISFTFIIVLTPFYDLAYIIHRLKDYEIVLSSCTFKFTFLTMLTVFFESLLFPIFEELFVRELIQKRLHAKNHYIISIVLVAFIFTAMHILNINKSFYTSYLLGVFLFALFQGVIYYKTRDVLLNIIIHSFWNFYCNLFDFKTINTSQVTVILGILVYLSCLVLLLKTIKNLKSNNYEKVRKIKLIKQN